MTSLNLDPQCYSRLLKTNSRRVAFTILNIIMLCCVTKVSVILKSLKGRLSIQGHCAKTQ